MKSHPFPTPSEKQFDRFAHPWKYNNNCGILEVDANDIDDGPDGHLLGKGCKSSTTKVNWLGKEVALKRGCTSLSSGPMSQWELERYSDLQAVQGTLIPKLLFVSRDKKTGERLFGVELGSPVCAGFSLISPIYQREMDELDNKIKMHGWCQRPDSWRMDNVVSMKNEDGVTNRLVAIDLETFIPVSYRRIPISIRRHAAPIYGVPVINPREVQINHPCPSVSWEPDDKIRPSSSKNPKRWVAEIYPGHWTTYKNGVINVQGVSIVYYEDTSTFQHAMQRLCEWPENKMGAVAKPIFLALGRYGGIIVGHRKFETPIKNQQKRKKDYANLQVALGKLGWKGNPNYFRYESFGNDQIRLVVTCLNHLETVAKLEEQPRKCAGQLNLDGQRLKGYALKSKSKQSYSFFLCIGFIAAIVVAVVVTIIIAIPGTCFCGITQQSY